MLECCDGQALARHSRNPVAVKSGGVDDCFADHLSPVGFHHPFSTRISPDPDHCGESGDLGAGVAPPLGQCLGQLTWVYITLIRIVDAANDRISGFVVWMHCLHFRRVQHRQFVACRFRYTDDMPERIHAVAGMCRPECAGMTIGDRRVRRFRQVPVELPGIVAGAHSEPAVGVGRYVSGRVPG